MATEKRYNVALQQFFKWFKQFNTNLPDTFALDSMLCEYIHEMWNDGESLEMITNTISGLQHNIGALRGNLKGAWHLVTAWRKRELPNQAWPMPTKLMLVMAGIASSLGYYGMGVGLILAFHCFLRTGEVLELRVCDIVLNQNEGVVVLPVTKKGFHDFVTITDPWVASVIFNHVAQMAQNDKIVQVSKRTAYKVFPAIIKSMDLGPTTFQWYSLRRGGATNYFCQTGSMEQTMLRGRWDHPRTAKKYLAEGVALLSKLSMDTNPHVLFGLDLCRDYYMAH